MGKFNWDSKGLDLRKNEQELFLNMFKKCLEDGSISFDYEEGDNYFGNKESDRLVISVLGEEVLDVFM